MPLFYQPQIPQGVLSLDAEESRHALKVLRLKPGSLIDITDGNGKIYTATISETKKNLCYFRIQATREAGLKGFSMHIGIAPTKNMDRMEWFVEKATEIGIDQISFMLCEKSERKTLGLERLMKKAVGGMKQSGQARLPRLHPLKPFREMLDFSGQRLIAAVDHANPLHLQQVAKSHTDCLVLIGPEGDFSEAELALATARDFQKVSLGPNILRTETAGLVACHILSLINLSCDGNFARPVPSPLPR